MLRLHNNHKKIISDMFFSYNTVLKNKDSTILLFFDFLLLSNTILCRHIGIQQNDQEYAIYHKRQSLNINHNENLQSDERKVGTQKIKHFYLTIQLDLPNSVLPSILQNSTYLIYRIQNQTEQRCILVRLNICLKPSRLILTPVVPRYLKLYQLQLKYSITYSITYSQITYST